MLEFNRLKRLAILCGLAKIEEVKIAKIQKGDVLIFRCSEPLRSETAAMLQRHARAMFKDNSVLVLDPTMDLEIRRPENSK